MTRKFDFLVIGSGIAGIKFCPQSRALWQVALLCKTTLDESNTSFAQGGIAAVTYEPDNFENILKIRSLPAMGIATWLRSKK